MAMLKRATITYSDGSTVEFFYDRQEVDHDGYGAPVHRKFYRDPVGMVQCFDVTTFEGHVQLHDEVPAP